MSIPTTRRQSAITISDKMAWWISRRLNLLFRCGPGVGVAAEVSAAFHKSELRWVEISARSGEVDQAIADASVEALFIVGLDRAPKKVRQSVQAMFRERPNRKVVWASVTVSGDDFDSETANSLHAEDFDIVVDVPTQPTGPR